MSVAVRLLPVVMALLVPCLAHAYVGPGAGLSAIGSVLALIGAVLLLVVGFVWYPVKRLLKRRKGESSHTGTEADASVDPDSR